MTLQHLICLVHRWNTISWRIEQSLILTKLRCKNYYKLFIEKLAVEPTTIKSWKRYFPDLTDWNKCFDEIYKSSKDNKLRQFSFKVLHRIIPSKKELKKYNLINDDTCSLCPNSDSIEHTFVRCIESTNFFAKTMRWFNDFHYTKLQLSNIFNSFEGTFFSQLSNPHKSRLRLLISLQKK